MSKRQQRKDRRRRRTVKFEWDEETKAAIDELATEYGVPKSQISNLLALYGLDAIRKGKINIQKYLRETGAPQLFDWNLDLDEFKKDLDSSE